VIHVRLKMTRFVIFIEVPNVSLRMTVWF